MYERRSGKSNVGLILGIIAVVLVLSAGCCGGIIWYSMSKVGFAVEQGLFLSELSQGKVDDAYKRTSKKFQSKQSLEQFKEFVNKHPDVKSGNLQNAQTVGSPNIDTGPVTLNGMMGSTKVTLTVVKEDGSWKIDDFTAEK
jgi:hypothetical protein